MRGVNASASEMRGCRLRLDREQGAGQARCASRLLHLDKQVALEDELSLLVLLVVLVCILLHKGVSSGCTGPPSRGSRTYIFPAKYCVALDALDVTYNMVACGHLSFDGFTFKNVYSVGM